MSRFLTVLAGSMLLPTTLALGLPAPSADQALYNWDWAWETADYDGDGLDDTPAGTGDAGSLLVDLVSDCAVDYPNPSGQPKVPEGCGNFTSVDGGTGFYIYYDNTGLSSTSWWYNRLLVRYDHAAVVYRGKYRANESHSTCYTTVACGTGVKFCGDMKYTDAVGTDFFGNFNFCSNAI